VPSGLGRFLTRRRSALASLEEPALGGAAAGPRRAQAGAAALAAAPEKERKGEAKCPDQFLHDTAVVRAGGRRASV